MSLRLTVVPEGTIGHTEKRPRDRWLGRLKRIGYGQSVQGNLPVKFVRLVKSVLGQAILMPTVDVDRSKRADILRKVAEERFKYPSVDQPDWSTAVNFPDPAIGIRIRSGGWIYPDIVVTQEPGHFIQMVGIVTLRHEVTESEAVERWLPLSKAGPLFLFVPAGQAGRANSLCRRLSIDVAGIRTWRWTPTFGLDISDAYAGPDVFKILASLLPEILRPRAYRSTRVRVIESYNRPTLAHREELSEARRPSESKKLLATNVTPLDPPSVVTLPPGVHLPPPSPYPIVMAIGMALSGFGVIYPAELLSAGLAILVIGVLGWVKEDIVLFSTGNGHSIETQVSSEDHGRNPLGVHLPDPSIAPMIMALGAVMSGFGVMFPAELLGAGLAVLSLGVLKWVAEDVVGFSDSEEGHV